MGYTCSKPRTGGEAREESRLWNLLRWPRDIKCGACIWNMYWSRAFATTVLGLCYEETKPEVFEVFRYSFRSKVNIGLDRSKINRGRIVSLRIRALSVYDTNLLVSSEHIVEWLIKQLDILETNIEQMIREGVHSVPLLFAIILKTWSLFKHRWIDEVHQGRALDIDSQGVIAP